MPVRRWAMPAAGGETRQLTFDSHDDSEASWQPDGNGIVFTSDRVDRWSVWQMRLDSGKETLLARLGRDVDVVRLSPDGARLAFQATASDGSVNLSVRLPNEKALEELAEILLAYHHRQDRSKIIE